MLHPSTRYPLSHYHGLLLVALLISAVGISQPALGAGDSPYRIDRKEFSKQFTKLAIAPLEVTPSVSLSDPLSQLVEQELATRLEKKGFKLIPVSIYRGIREAMSQQVGGLKSAQGEIDVAKMNTVWEHSRREMLFQHDMQAIARPVIRQVNATFENDRAEWDGVKQRVSSRGDGLGKLFGGGRYAGTIAAVSLELAIFSRDGETLYLDRGGLEVLQARNGSSLVVLPAEELLKDDKMLKKAVRKITKAL